MSIFLRTKALRVQSGQSSRVLIEYSAGNKIKQHILNKLEELNDFGSKTLPKGRKALALKAKSIMFKLKTKL